ncbi:chitosanase [Actinomycetospora flava]|uniref:Chitosanase n=1 Tax=Actinomycetospora flava TaxID=3129232 RepID=A0ABU8M725_9PSEU
MNRRVFLALAGLAAWPVLTGCSSAAPVPAPRAPGLDDPDRKHVAEAIISSFENSTTTLPYDAAQRLDDGRGITAGRAGFTSGTHDLLLVVRRYEQVAGPQNPLHRYVRPLTRIDEQGGGSGTSGLDGFEDVWRRTSRTDPRLNQAQDAVYDELYFRPAMDQSRPLGLTTALGQLVILDTAVQHGRGGPDGLLALIAETDRQQEGGSDAERTVWLRQFLEVRRAHLRDPADDETTEVWRESIPRVDTLVSLIDQRRFDLATPLTWTFAGSRFSVG